MSKPSDSPQQPFFGRIFWKFFGAFWLANLVIMIATTYVLLHHTESQRLRDDYQRGISVAVEHLLAAQDHKGGLTYEGSDHEESNHKTRKLMRRLFRGPHNQVKLIHVYEHGELIFAYDDHAPGIQPDATFDLTLADGRQVEVRTSAPRLPKMLLDILFRIHRLHLIIMLLVSAAISLLLSWSVTRPLKQLGMSSRLFALGQDADLSPSLLRRRDEFGQLARDFDHMMSKVSHTLISQKQLLHDVSHELRAPLARLQVAAELIQQKDTAGNAHIRRIHAECERIDQLIQRILNYSRLEQASCPAQVDLSTLVQQLVDNIRYENPQRAVHLQLPDTPITLFGRAELLAQAIENICRNACQHTPADCTIDIFLECEHSQVTLLIRDHGPGVAEQDLPKLMEPFYRAGQEMHGSGFGLGLSIAQRAIEANQGTLEFSNHPEGGLQARIHLPIKPN